METHHALNANIAQSPAPAPEAVLHLSQITTAALEALSLDCYFTPCSRSGEFACPQSEWKHQTYNFPGCPDASKLVEFFAGHKTKPLWPNYNILIDPEVSELCSWLLRHGDESVRSDILTGLCWGVPEPSYGIEPVISQFLNAPQSDNEFYCAVSWCLRTDTLPLRPGVVPAWIADCKDSSRASSLAKAWTIVATMINEPENLCALLNAEVSRRGVPHPVACELSRMLYGGEVAHTPLLRGMIERVRHLPSIARETPPLVSGLLGRFALVTAAASPLLARSFLSTLSEKGLKPIIRSALGGGGGSGPLASHLRSFDQDGVGPTALRRLCEKLTLVSATEILPRISDSIIKLSSMAIYAIDPYTHEANVYRALYQFASQQGLRGLTSFVYTRTPQRWTDEGWEAHLSEQAWNLLETIPNIIDDIRSLGLERELLPLIFTEACFDEIKDNKGTAAKSIKYAHALKKSERYPILENALMGAGPMALAHFPSSLQALLLLGKFPSLHVECIGTGPELAEIFLLNYERGVAALQFLSACPDQDLNPSISWPKDDSPSVQRKTVLSDRIKFLARFANVCAFSDEPIEEIYKRLDDPAHPLFSRERSRLSEMFACSKPLKGEAVVPLFEKLARAYSELEGGFDENIQLHQRLLLGEEVNRMGWLRVIAGRPISTNNLDLEKEFRAFSEYVKIFGWFRDEHLYSHFSQFFMLDEHHPMAGQVRTPDQYRERLTIFRSALAEDRFNLSFIRDSQDVSLLCLAIGGDALGSRSFRDKLQDQRLWVSGCDSPPRPPIATLTVRTTPRKSSAHKPLSGVMQQVRKFRDTLTSCAPPEKAKESVKAEVRTLSAAVKRRIEELLRVEGKGAFFARKNIQPLESMRASLARTETLKDFIETCVIGQRFYGKEIDNEVITAIRRLGIQARQDQLPSRHRSWTDSVYEDREQLEGCVGVIREELRDANFDLSPEGRTLWKRAFSVKGLEEEVARLHELDGKISGFGEEVEIDIRRGGDFISNIAGYVCQSCLPWYYFEELLEKNITFSDIHPNATFYTFARRYQQGPRLIGGTFILDTQTVSNEGVWLVRGFNPIQSAALALDIGQLFERFIESIAPAARERGIAYIAVPHDLYSGRTQTNRPSVHAYIARTYYQHPTIVKLAPHAPLNDLPVTQACVVRTLSRE